MTENEELRQEMEAYVRQHDLPRLFERLAASIMYDRPEDVNRYAGEWLLRLNVNAEESKKVASKTSTAPNPRRSDASLPATSKVASKPSISERKSSNNLMNKRSVVEGPVVSGSAGELPVSEPAQLDLVLPEPVASAKSLCAPKSATEIPSNELWVQDEGKNEFDPYIFTPKNIAIFYGMLDPLNEGSISLEHFREVAALMDVEQHIDWDDIHESAIQQDTFYDLLMTALKRDLEILRTGCTPNAQNAPLFNIGETEAVNQ